MRYVLYIFTILLLFVGGMLVGNSFLPTRGASLAASVSAPGLPEENPIFQTLTREQAQRDLEMLVQALGSCPAVVSEKKEDLLNRVRLRLAMEEFELKRTILALELAKNDTSTRPTSQLTQATAEYTQSRERVLKMAKELFPVQTLPAQQTAEPETTTPPAGTLPSEP